MNYSLSMLFMKWLLVNGQPIITEDREVKDTWNAVRTPRQESQSLAHQNHPEAMFLMGTAYAEGLGKEKDAAIAASWYQRAALLGNTLAQHNMGNIYESGTGVRQDDAQAVYWWLQAAVGGDAIPQWQLGRMYESGRGVEKNLNEALRWYRDSAARGNARAQQALARLE
jgi:TPR repeat protein